MRISDWSSDVCSSDLLAVGIAVGLQTLEHGKSVLQSATGDRYRQGIASAHAGRVPAAVFAMLRVCDVGAEYAAEAKCFRFRPVGRQGSFVEIVRASCRERGCQYG